MKAYIASRLENAPAVRELRDLLLHLGAEITYDWTPHGSVQADGPDRIAEVAVAEIEGVTAADVVVVLLPGGRGTHAELGVAIGLDKPVFLVGLTGDTSGRECAFYSAPSVIRLGDISADRVALAICAWWSPSPLANAWGSAKERASASWFAARASVTAILDAPQAPR